MWFQFLSTRASRVDSHQGRPCFAPRSIGAPSQPQSCCPPAPVLLVMAVGMDAGFQGLCSSHRCLPLDFEEVNGMASIAPLLFNHEPVRAEKPSVVLAISLPLSCQSRIFVMRVSSLESGVRGRASTLFPQRFSQTPWLGRKLWHEPT